MGREIVRHCILDVNETIFSENIATYENLSLYKINICQVK